MLASIVNTNKPKRLIRLGPKYAHVGLVNPGKRTGRTIERGRKQMTVERSTDASSTSPPLTWKTIDWPLFHDAPNIGELLRGELVRSVDLGQPSCCRHGSGCLLYTSPSPR